MNITLVLRLKTNIVFATLTTYMVNVAKIHTSGLIIERLSTVVNGCISQSELCKAHS